MTISTFRTFEDISADTNYTPLGPRALCVHLTVSQPRIERLQRLPPLEDPLDYPKCLNRITKAAENRVKYELQFK